MRKPTPPSLPGPYLEDRSGVRSARQRWRCRLSPQYDVSILRHEGHSCLHNGVHPRGARLRILGHAPPGALRLEMADGPRLRLDIVEKRFPVLPVSLLADFHLTI